MTLHRSPGGCLGEESNCLITSCAPLCGLIALSNQSHIPSLLPFFSAESIHHLDFLHTQLLNHSPIPSTSFHSFAAQSDSQHPIPSTSLLCLAAGTSNTFTHMNVRWKNCHSHRRSETQSRGTKETEGSAQTWT